MLPGTHGELLCTKKMCDDKCGLNARVATHICEKPTASEALSRRFFRTQLGNQARLCVFTMQAVCNAARLCGVSPVHIFARPSTWSQRELV